MKISHYLLASTQGVLDTIITCNNENEHSSVCYYISFISSYRQLDFSCFIGGGIESPRCASRVLERRGGGQTGANRQKRAIHNADMKMSHAHQTILRAVYIYRGWRAIAGGAEVGFIAAG